MPHICRRGTNHRPTHHLATQYFDQPRGGGSQWRKVAAGRSTRHVFDELNDRDREEHGRQNPAPSPSAHEVNDQADWREHDDERPGQSTQGDD